MKRTIKTEEILAVWQVLSKAKYAKMDSSDRIKVWKISRVIEPIAKGYDAEVKSAQECMKPEGFDEKALKWNEMRDKVVSGVKDDLPMTNAEFAEFTYRVLNPYNKDVNDALEELRNKDVDVEFEPITESAFEKLMDSNDWTMEQVTVVGDFIVG